MPRKNPQHVQAVLRGSTQRYGSYRRLGGQPLQHLSHMEVAARLNGAQLFLAFGHPEGFGLPIAEAMAAGCWVVGYSGGGGQELFRFGGADQVAFGDCRALLLRLSAFAILRYPRETAFDLGARP